MPTRRTYQVKQVARLTGLTIRTLHHYDSIGLLAPSARSAAGYRLYDDDDLLRLQQILIGRELGLSLEAIRRSLDDPRFDRRQALLAQRTELAARADARDRDDSCDRCGTHRHRGERHEQSGHEEDFRRVRSGSICRRGQAALGPHRRVQDLGRSARRPTRTPTGRSSRTSRRRSTPMRSPRVRPACAPMSRVRWTSRSGIGCRSTVGSIPAARRCTAALRTCGKPIGATRTTSTRQRRRGPHGISRCGRARERQALADVSA